jgi:hypothetical protein
MEPECAGRFHADYLWFDFFRFYAQMADSGPDLIEVAALRIHWKAKWRRLVHCASPDCRKFLQAGFKILVGHQLPQLFIALAHFVHAEVPRGYQERFVPQPAHTGAD